MRKSLLLAVLVCLCATVAQSQEKVESQWTCPKSTPTTSNTPAASKAKSSHMTVTFTCTASKGEIAGVKEKDGTGNETDVVTGDKVSGKGTFVETAENGDKITYGYSVNGTMKDGNFQSGTNKWHAESGTGKFKGIKASGTCAAKGNADGSITFDCTGKYKLPKS